MKKFALLLAFAFAHVPLFAAPPKITIPPEVRPSGQYVDFLPETDAVSVTYVGLDGIDAVPSNRLNNPTAFLLDTYGKDEKKYRFAAVASSKDGEQKRVDFVVIIGKPKEDGGGTKPPPTPEEPPPVKPDPTPSGKSFIVIARMDGPIDPGLANALEMPGWKELKKAGHGVKDYPFKDLPQDCKDQIVTGTTMPCVFKLALNKDGKGRAKAGKPIDFPKDNDAILALSK